MLNLFLALLLSSFSADKIAPVDEPDKNLQVAYDRIHRGIAFMRSIIRSGCSSGCLKRDKRGKAEEKSLDELHKPLGPNGVPNHTIKDFSKNGNGDVTGVDKSGNKYIVKSQSDNFIMSFINNPSLTVTVPIAVGESDFENLNTDDFSSASSDVACHVVSGLILALALSFSLLEHFGILCEYFFISPLKAMQMCVVGLDSFACLPCSLQDNSDILFSPFSTILLVSLWCLC